MPCGGGGRYERMEWEKQRDSLRSTIAFLQKELEVRIDTAQYWGPGARETVRYCPCVLSLLRHQTQARRHLFRTPSTLTHTYAHSDTQHTPHTHTHPHTRTPHHTYTHTNTHTHIGTTCQLSSQEPTRLRHALREVQLASEKLIDAHSTDREALMKRLKIYRGF
jgi:hypothetical protein